MSATANASKPPAPRTSRLRPWMLPVAFIGVGLLIALTFGYLQSTVVKGIEFDTQSWTIRRFWYRRDPFSGSQLTGILREPPAGINIAVTNFPNSYFNAPSSVPARWDLVELRSGTAVTEGPANVLYRYFEAYAAETFWTKWSTNNVPKANELWSAARDLVDLELYHELPKIVELAKVDSTDEEFKSLIRTHMRAILTAQREQLEKSEKTESLTLVESTLKRYSAADEQSSKK